MSNRTTWKLSGFGDEIDADPAIQVAVLQALGANHIEVRSAWEVNVLDLTDAQLAELAALFVEKGMGVSAIGSPIGKVDVSEPVEHEVNRLARAIEAARVLSTKYVRIFSFYHPDREPEEVRDDVMLRMKALAKTAEDAGVILVLENERDLYGDIPSRVLDVLETVNSPALRMAWDAGNFVTLGVSPFDDAYESLRPYLEYLQVKDKDSSGAVRAAGEGDGQILETVEALRDSGYTGFASLEPHLKAMSNMGGFSGPTAFGFATRAFAAIAAMARVDLA